MDWSRAPRSSSIAYPVHTALMVSELVLLRPASVPTNDDFYVRAGQCCKRESMISDLKNFINLRFNFPRPQVFVGEDGGVVITGLYDGIPADADYSHEAFDHIIDLVGWIEGCVKLPISSDSVAHKVFEEMSPVAITSEIDQLLKLDGKRIIENMGLDQNPIYEVLKRDVIAIHGEEMAQTKLKSEPNNAKHLADSVAQQVLNEMTEQRTNFNTIEVRHLTDSKHLMLSNQGLTGFTGRLDELIIQDDVTFDPGGELNADLVEKSDVIDNDNVFTAERLIIDDDVVNQDEELVQIKANDDSKVENGTTHSVAQQSLDEMPEWKFGVEIKFGMLSQSRASSFGSLMNPPHYLAPYFGSTEVNFTLQKWLLRIAWAALNTDAEMLPFEPGGSWLTYLTDKIDHKAMLVGFIEERDDMKTFKATEHRKTIRPLTSDKEPHNLTVFEMCFVLGGRLYASSEAFMVMVNTELADVGDSLGDKYKLKLFEGEFALDQGGGLHTSSNTVLSTDATKLTEIGNWSVQLSCAEIWVTTTDNHVGSWKSKVTSKNGEFMLRNVDEDNLRSLYSIRMQKLELFDHDQLMGLSGQDDCVKLLMFVLEHGEFMLVELGNGFMLQDWDDGESLPSYKAFKPLVFDLGIIFKGEWEFETGIASLLCGTLRNWKYPHLVANKLAHSIEASNAIFGLKTETFQEAQYTTFLETTEAAENIRFVPRLMECFLIKELLPFRHKSVKLLTDSDFKKLKFSWSSKSLCVGILIFDLGVQLFREVTEPFLEENLFVSYSLLEFDQKLLRSLGKSFDPGDGLSDIYAFWFADTGEFYWGTYGMFMYNLACLVESDIDLTEVLIFDPGGKELMLDDHAVRLSNACDSYGWLILCSLTLCLSCCSCLYPTERVNRIANIFVDHANMGVGNYELLSCCDMKWGLISETLKDKILPANDHHYEVKVGANVSVHFLHSWVVALTLFHYRYYRYPFESAPRSLEFGYINEYQICSMRLVTGTTTILFWCGYLLKCTCDLANDHGFAQLFVMVYMLKMANSQLQKSAAHIFVHKDSQACKLAALCELCIARGDIYGKLTSENDILSSALPNLLVVLKISSGVRYPTTSTVVNESGIVFGFDLGGEYSMLTSKAQRARFVSRVFKEGCSLSCYASKVMVKWKTAHQKMPPDYHP